MAICLMLISLRQQQIAAAFQYKLYSPFIMRLKLVTIFFLALNFFAFVAPKKVQFVSTKCLSSNLTFATVECIIRDNNTTADILLNFIQPFENINVRKTVFKNFNKQIANLIFPQKLYVSYSVKNDSEFRQIFKVSRIRWCSLVNGKSTTSFLAKAVISLIKQQYPQFIHDCPYSGSYNMLDVKKFNGIIEIFPEGFIKTSAKIIDGDKKKSISIESILQIL